MANNTGVKITRQNLSEVLAAVTALAGSEVLVGFPEDSTDRDATPGDDPEKRGITNAALGYIHDNGAPEANIPARPFMLPGMKDAEKQVEAYLGGAMKAAMRGNVVAAEGQMQAAGMAAKLAIQRKINEGIPPPLSERTLRARARKGRKGAILELERREKGYDPLTVLAKPLIDTGQMRNAVNYVIRARKKRR
jgi:hypothetical protein